MHTLKTLCLLWLISIILIVFCYLSVDRNLTDFIYMHHWASHLSALRLVIEWPPVITGFCPFILLIMLLLRCRNPNPPKWQRMLLTLSVTVIFAFVLKNEFKWIFSRYWPQTWTNNNLSWISNHTYGFQWFQGKPFQGTDATGSFPSGHSTIAFASLLTIGLFYRRILWLCISLASLEALSMVAFNYHFMSDIIAGAALGSTCALLCYQLLETKGLSCR